MLQLASGDAVGAATALSQIAPKLQPSRDTLRVWLMFGEAVLRAGDRNGAVAVAQRFLSTKGIPRDYRRKFQGLLARSGPTK